MRNGNIVPRNNFIHKECIIKVFETISVASKIVGNYFLSITSLKFSSIKISIIKIEEKNMIFEVFSVGNSEHFKVSDLNRI